MPSLFEIYPYIINYIINIALCKFNFVIGIVPISNLVSKNDKTNSPTLGKKHFAGNGYCFICQSNSNTSPCHF